MQLYWCGPQVKVPIQYTAEIKDRHVLVKTIAQHRQLQPPWFMRALAADPDADVSRRYAYGLTPGEPLDTLLGDPDDKGYGAIERGNARHHETLKRLLEAPPADWKQTIKVPFFPPHPRPLSLPAGRACTLGEAVQCRRPWADPLLSITRPRDRSIEGGSGAVGRTGRNMTNEISKQAL